ncbi:MAG: hypothetical protein LUG49_09020 [Oscillospiraceae bacterium]|nr:hypothetical protein [Oscillospiraceae bacterium]
MTNFDDYLNEQLKNPKFKAEYEALEEEYASMKADVEAQRKSRTIQYNIPEIAVKPGYRVSYSLDVRESRPSRNELRRHSKEERQKLKLAK